MRNMRGQRPDKMRGHRNNFRRYIEYPRVPAREPGNRRFDMPNIYSQVIFYFVFQTDITIAKTLRALTLTGKMLITRAGQ